MGLILWNILTPRFYLALTASSFFISILILLFEWWYFAKYGISFIEQILMNILSPIFGTNGAATPDPTDDDSGSSPPAPVTPADVNHTGNGAAATTTTSNARHLMQGHISLDSKVWRNPMSLFRGAEYNQLTVATKKEPLTFYDMNLSAQDHQTFFTYEGDAGREDMEIMLTAWRERDPEVRIRSAHKALEKNPECAPAYILLAEEEAKTIWEAEKILMEGLRAAETQYRRSQQPHHHNHPHQNHHQMMEAQHRRDLNVLIYIRRRLAMCARKLGKLREAVKMMRDLIKEFPMMNLFNIHENLIEALLEMNAYADVQALLAKYDDINLPKSATICYTAALLKSRNIGEKFSPDMVVKRGLSISEMNAVEAIHRAVEFNPHVPKYLLEMKKLIFPPEHILKRGDSEAIAYAFFHLAHWKRIDGALNLLDCTWKGTFRIIPFPLEKGHLFYPYLTCTECTDRELLPDYHEVSVYPKKSIPFFIRFTASLCTLTAIMTFIFYQYPVQIVFLIQSPLATVPLQFLAWLSDTFNTMMDRIELVLPQWINQYVNLNYWQ